MSTSLSKGISKVLSFINWKVLKKKTLFTVGNAQFCLPTSAIFERLKWERRSIPRLAYPIHFFNIEQRTHKTCGKCESPPTLMPRELFLLLAQGPFCPFDNLVRSVLHFCANVLRRLPPPPPPPSGWSGSSLRSHLVRRRHLVKSLLLLGTLQNSSVPPPSPSMKSVCGGLFIPAEARNFSSLLFDSDPFFKV